MLYIVFDVSFIFSIEYNIIYDIKDNEIRRSLKSDRYDWNINNDNFYIEYILS